MFGQWKTLTKAHFMEVGIGSSAKQTDFRKLRFLVPKQIRICFESLLYLFVHFTHSIFEYGCFDSKVYVFWKFFVMHVKRGFCLVFHNSLRIECYLNFCFSVRYAIIYFLLVLVKLLSWRENYVFYPVGWSFISAG